VDLKLIPAPMQRRNAPINAPDPFANDVVRPPIFKTAGKNVLRITPINRGTIIIPPGIFSMVALIFMG
jgi:hypothetical protein